MCFLGFFMQNVAKPKEIFAIDYVLENVSLTSGPTEFKKGEILTIKAKAADGYAINQSKLQIVMGSNNITSNCTFTAGDKDEEGQILNCTITIPSAQTKLIGKGEKITLALEAFEIIEDLIFAVAFYGDGIKHPEPLAFRNGDVLTIKYEALDGYAINMGSLDLKLGSKQLTSANYTISNENYGYKDQLFGFTLNIPAATTNMAVEGDSLIITLNGVVAEITPTQYTVTYHLNNITEPSTKYVTEKTAFSEIFAVDKNQYAIEVDDIMVKIGGSNYTGFITTVKNASQDGATKLELSIPASAVTGNIDIYMDAIEYFDVTYAFARNDGTTANNISVENKVTRVGRQKPFTIKLVAAQGSFILDYGIKIGDASTELGDVIEGTHYTKTETTYEANINGTDYTYVTAVSITMLDKGVVDDIQFGATEGYMAVQLYNVEFDVTGDTDYEELKSVVNLPAPIAVESGNTATFDTSNILSAENEKYYNIIEYKVYIKDENGNLTNPVKYNVTDTLSITNVINDLVVKAVVYVDYYNITWNNGKYGYTIANKPTKVTRNGSLDLSVQFHNPDRVAYPKYTMGSTTGTWITESSANNYYTYRLQIAKVTSDVVLDLDSVELYTISYNTDSDRLTATDVSPITVEHNTGFTAEMMARPAEYVGGAHIKPNSWYVHVHNIAGDVQNVTSACTFTTTKAVSEADGSEVITAFKVTVPGDVVYGHIEIGAIGQYTQKNTYTVTWAVNDNQYLNLVNLPETQAVFYNETYHNNTPLTFTQEFEDFYQISPTELISIYTEDKGDDSWEYAGKITPQSSGLYTRLNVTSNIKFVVNIVPNYWTVTKNIDTEAFTLLTSIPDKVGKGKSLTFDVKSNNVFKYNYSTVSFKRGSDVKKYLSNDWTETITNGIRVTIPTTGTTGDIVINLSPDLKDIIPVTFNLSNGDGTQFFFSPLMDANAFVNASDFVQYTVGATNGIKHQQTVDLYVGSTLMGSAYTSNYDKTKQWSIANITSNYDDSVVYDAGAPLDSNSISFDTSRISLNNLSGYAVNVLYTTAYNSKVIYAIRNETNDSYYVTFGGSTPWSVQASDQYGSGGGTSYNSNCASIALKNATGEPSRWYTRAFRPTAVDADIENRSYYVGHYTDEERTIDNIMEVGSSGSRAQVFEYNQYNALNPANPGYANWNPDSTGDSIQYGLEINGVVSLFKDENVAFTEANSVKDGVVYGIRYQVSNDGGVTWSEEVAAAGYDNIEPNVTCNAGFTAPKLYTEIKGVENNRTLGLLKIIIVLKPNYDYY